MADHPKLKCWDQVSLFNIRIILTLIVAVPYLIGLISVVAYFGIKYEKDDVQWTGEHRELLEITEESIQITRPTPVKYSVTTEDELMAPEDGHDTMNDPLLHDITLPKIRTNKAKKKRGKPIKTITAEDEDEYPDFYRRRQKKTENAAVVETNYRARVRIAPKYIQPLYKPAAIPENADDRAQYRVRSKALTTECICPPESSPEFLDCSEKYFESSYPFIAALNEIIFIDAPKDTEIRFRCVAVIINKYLALTSSDCISNDRKNYNYLQIIAGSDDWASDEASFHTIEKVVYNDGSSENHIVLIKVKPIFPNIASISHANLSNEELDPYNTFDTYTWNNTYFSPFEFRRKHNDILSAQIQKSMDCQCTHPKAICNIEKDVMCSDSYFTSGNPLFIKDKLIGMQISSSCDQQTRQITRCYIGLSKYSRWIQTMVTKYNT